MVPCKEETTDSVLSPHLFLSARSRQIRHLNDLNNFQFPFIFNETNIEQIEKSRSGVTNLISFYNKVTGLWMGGQQCMS